MPIPTLPPFFLTFSFRCSLHLLSFHQIKMHILSNFTPLFFFTSLVLLLPPCFAINGASDLHRFIYRYCSTSNLNDSHGVFRSTRQTLLLRLASESTRRKFHKTAVVPGGGSAAVWGHFQCRGDLTAGDCHSCVESLSRISSNTWCANSLAARVQLAGCLVHYEADGSEIPGGELTHKVCGEESADAAGGGFGEARGAALEAVEKGVVENPDGYCSVDVGGVYATAQCAAGVRGCDCAECVATAAGAAEGECAASVSAQVYMDMCFVSFEFRPEGGSAIPRSGKLGGGIGSSGKLVAIGVGGVALLGIGFLLLQNFRKKDED